MPELLTMQDLANGHLDVKALGEAANGDENTIVTTRTGKTYPSAERAINVMFQNGGLPAKPVPTLAHLQTEGVVLGDGDYAQVTDDTVNNGLYVKTAGVWVKSEYDPQALAKTYTDEKSTETLDAAKIDASAKDVAVKLEAVAQSDLNTSRKMAIESDDILDAAQDKIGGVYRYTDKDGSLNIIGINKAGSVQSNINALHVNAENTPKLSLDSSLEVHKDTEGNVYQYTDSEANLHISGSVYSNGKLLEAQTTVSDIDARYENILKDRYPRIKDLLPVATVTEDGGTRKRMIAGIKTPTGLLTFYHQQTAGFDGDVQGSTLMKSIINIDADFTATVTSRGVFLAPDAPRGIVKHPMLGRTSDGRIILIYEKRLETTDPYVRYQCYSSDEGLTFTAPTVFNPSGFDPSKATDSGFLGITGLILTAKNGRLVLPMHTLSGTLYAAYSDDDGASWTYSDFLRPLKYGHEPSITLDYNGNILMDIRPLFPGFRKRAISYDNGETWQLLSTQQLKSPANQGTIIKDESIGVMIQTHNNISTASRTNYRWSLSYDNDTTYPLYYAPYANTKYVGYTQIVKITDGVYALLLEYADTFINVNNNESVGVLILTLNEVLSNVYRN